MEIKWKVKILTSQRLAGRICGAQSAVSCQFKVANGAEEKDRRSNPAIVPPTPEFTDDRG
jgi:hypothetical protein